MESALEGAKVRFRPILMTSFAFVAGLIPLVISHGAGAIGNRTIGGSAMGGMLFGTIFGVLVIPGLYLFFAKLAGDRKLIQDQDQTPLSEDIVDREYSAGWLKKLKKLGLVIKVTGRKNRNK